ncbi:Heat shock transcription factor, X-linked [Vulpes lagopus]
MAREEDGHPTGPGPGHYKERPPPEATVSAATSQNSAPAAEPPGRPAGSSAAEDPSFRLLLEENAFQALAQEPLLKRPRTVEDALSVAGGNLLCLPFPKKLWRLVNSSRFMSIWWEKDRTSIGLKEKLFQKEILERDRPEEVFETDCTKSFIRQLNLYGFSKLCKDVHTSFCLTNGFTGSVGAGPVRVLSKVTVLQQPSLQEGLPPPAEEEESGREGGPKEGEDKAEGLGSPAEVEPSSGPPEELCALRSTSRSSNRSW